MSIQKNSSDTWLTSQLAGPDFSSFVRDARDYALTHGLVLRYPYLGSDNCVGHIPVTLAPSPIPKSLYEQCLEVQPTINKLMFRIANDESFIESSLGEIVRIDDFTRNLFNIRSSLSRLGQAQPIISCINRSDYMLDLYSSSAKPDGQSLRMRQVEVNAIASAMSSHSCNVNLMHNYLMSKYRVRIDQERGCSMAENRSLDLVSNGLIEAYDLYSRQDGYILIITEEMSLNFSDHFLIEQAINEKRPDIRCVRRRFMDLPSVASLGPNNELLVDGKKEIAVVYFRYGYDPSNYNFDLAWDYRLIIERSMAIKCPSISFHISGVKKFQQILCNQIELERFLESKEAEKLSNLFCKFWSLDPDSPKGEDGFQMGLKSPENLVLKPQREGGGHNIFGGAIKPFLENISDPSERSKYILMEHITSPREKNWLLLKDEDPASDSARLTEPEQLVSELGIFGSIVADVGGEIKSSRAAGYLIRSKRSGVNEGGVASGYAGIGSLMLLDDTKANSMDEWATYYH